MLNSRPMVFLLDVDNTLLDNDRFSSEFSAWLDAAVGTAERGRYWAIYDELREQLGYADYLGAVQRFRADSDNPAAMLQIAAYLLEYPFADRLYPLATNAIAHLDGLGTTLIVSDGDMVFQPRKIQRSGLWTAVAGRVQIHVHKQRQAKAIGQQYPSAHFVMIDDKPQLLHAMKQEMGARLTTVFVRQGHYAAAQSASTVPAADLSIERIGDLCELATADFLSGAAQADPALNESNQESP